MKTVTVLLFMGLLALNVTSRAEESKFKPDFSPLKLASYYAATDEQKALVKPDDSASVIVKRGYELYAAKCEMCHSYGYEKGATLRLARRYQGNTPALIALRTDLNKEVIEAFVRKPTVGMPPFRITEISPSDMNDLVAYLTRLNDRK